MPSSTYEVQVYSSQCEGRDWDCFAFSAPVMMFTRRWGDNTSPFNPPNPVAQPDALDLVQIVNKFRNVATAPPKVNAMLQPNSVEPLIDISALDIVACVDAFRGLAYPFSGPCPCFSPAGVPCRATACTVPSGCIGLYGPGSTCVRECSGGIRHGEPCIVSANCPAGVCAAGFCRDSCGRCE